jgi:hypothetical protein
LLLNEIANLFEYVCWHIDEALTAASPTCCGMNLQQ